MAGTHPTAHWHARAPLSVLWGRNVGAEPPQTRGEALKLLREAEKILSGAGPKRRGGWRVTTGPQR